MSSESILLWRGRTNGFIWPDDSNMVRKASWISREKEDVIEASA